MNANRFDQHRISMRGLFDLSHLEPRVLSHLRHVYACMAFGLLSAIVGICIGMYMQPMHGLIAGLVSLGLIFYLHSGRDDFSPQRHAVFAAFCALVGSGLAPLIGLAIYIDPSILVKAVIVTLVVTVCFSGVSLLAKNNRFLMYLAGPLVSSLTLWMLLSLLNFFAQSQLMFDIVDILAYLLFSIFLIYHTQKIVEMARHGDKDYILHCLDLFRDVADVFRTVQRILIRFRDTEERAEEE